MALLAVKKWGHLEPNILVGARFEVYVRSTFYCNKFIYMADRHLFNDLFSRTTLVSWQ